MRKEELWSMECELSGAEQMIHMIKKQLKAKKTDITLVRKWLRELQSNVLFVDFIINKQDR